MISVNGVLAVNQRNQTQILKLNIKIYIHLYRRHTH